MSGPDVSGLSAYQLDVYDTVVSMSTHASARSDDGWVKLYRVGADRTCMWLVDAGLLEYREIVVDSNLTVQLYDKWVRPA